MLPCDLAQEASTCRVRCPSGALGKHGTLGPHSSQVLEQIKGLCYFSVLTLSGCSQVWASPGWLALGGSVQLLCTRHRLRPVPEPHTRFTGDHPFLTGRLPGPDIQPCLFCLPSHHLYKPGRRGLCPFHR